MKIIQKTGFFIFILCLGVFICTLSMSNYKLTDEVLQSTALNYNENGKQHAELLRPGLAPMMNKTYSSKFSFISDYLNHFKALNQEFEKKGQPENVVKESYLFFIVKHSSTGILADAQWIRILFFISFILSCIGALMYIIPQYVGQPYGIKNNGIYHSSATSRGWIGITIGTFLILFYIILYFGPAYITNWVILVDPLSYAMTGKEASQWFLYGFIYTIAMLVMGIRMYLKYRGNPYQQIRTFSVMGFQTVFAFLLPNLMAELHGQDLKYLWPLNYDHFDNYKMQEYLGADAPQTATAVYLWIVALSLVGVPLFSYFYGKRWYCSWVCGCGGLAETAGDPYRQLSDKKLRAWKIERYLIHGVLVFAVVMTILLVLAFFKVFDPGTAGYVKFIYGFFIGAIFSGVVGTGFYPLMGSRVWCRFGCPLAAYIGLFQRFKSRFRITTNGGQCISCGNCSTYCEMGIDVRWYAQRGQNIVRSSCVGCGVCSSVCPRGVLKLENGPNEGRINEDPIIIGREGVKLNSNL